MVKNELIFLIRSYKYKEALNLLNIIDDNIINSYEIQDNPLYILCNDYYSIIFNKYYIGNFINISKKNNIYKIRDTNNIFENTKPFYTLFNELIKRNIQLNSNNNDFLIDLCSLIDLSKLIHQENNKSIDFNNFINIPLFVNYLINNNIHKPQTLNNRYFLDFLINNYNLLNETQLNILFDLINQNVTNNTLNNNFFIHFIDIQNYKILDLLKDKYTFEINNINSCFRIRWDYHCPNNYYIIHKNIMEQCYTNEDYNNMLETFINIGYKIKVDKYDNYPTSLLYSLIEMNLFNIAEKIVCNNKVYIDYNNIDDDYNNINNYNRDDTLNYGTAYPLIHLIKQYINCNNIDNKQYFKYILHYYLEKKVYCHKDLIEFLIECKCSDVDELLLLIINNYKNMDLSNDTSNFYSSFIYKTLINHKYNLTVILLENNAFCSYDFITFKQSIIYFIIKYIICYKNIDESKNKLNSFYQPVLNNKLDIIPTEKDITKIKEDDFKILLKIIKIIYNKDDNYNIEMLKSVLSKKIVNYIVN